MDIFTPHLAAIKDPEINLQQKKNFPIIKGAILNSIRNYNATTHSDSFTHFNVPPPSPTTFVSRRIIVTAYLAFRIVIPTAQVLPNNATRNAAIPPTSGICAYPILSSTRTLELVINGQSIMINSEEICKPLTYYNPHVEYQDNTTAPKYPDLISDPRIAGLVNEVYGGGVAGVLPNSMLNSLVVRERGQFRPVNISQPFADGNNNTVTDVVFEITEELMIPPLLFQCAMGEGFIGIQKFDINITWNPSFGNLIQSYTDNNTANQISFQNISWTTLPGGEALPYPIVTFDYKTPPMNIQIPPYIQYPYHEWRNYITSTAAAPGNYLNPVAAGAALADVNGTLPATISSTSQNIQLNCIPRYLYVWVRPNLSGRTRNAGNWGANANDSTVTAQHKLCSFGAINRISVNWNNETSLLDTAQTKDLYEVSRKNGYGYSYSSWAGLPIISSVDTDTVPTGGADQYMLRGNGSILCLEFGKDICLKEYEAPGLIGTYNLQLTVDWYNPTSLNWDDAELNLVTCMPGIFTIYNNSASKRIGVVDVQDVMNVMPKEGITWESVHDMNLMGGLRFKSLLNKSKKFAKHLGRSLRPEVAKRLPASFMPAYDLITRRQKPGPKRRARKAARKAAKAAPAQPGATEGSGAMVAGRRRRKPVKRRRGRKPGPKKGRKKKKLKRGRGAYVGGAKLKRDLALARKLKRRGGKLVNKRELANLIKNL